jgi:NAD(P)-dependent dehydrogenase (short-subunit alcohol dehydrogenase family)
MSRVAIVTGGGRGIGAAVSARLAALGFDVAVAYRADRESAERVAGECAAAGVRAVPFPADVAREGDVVRLFEAVDEQLGAVTALVNNAGIVAPKSALADMSAARIRRMMEVNVVGSLLCAREAVRRMSTAGGGSGGVVVNVSSAASRVGSPGEYVDYAASKGAIDTFTLGLSKEVAREGIRVNAVRPGIIETGIHASGGQPDRVERVAPLVPMGRAGRPEEVAALIAWLCTEDASYITGAIIDVSGGR